MDYVTAMVQLSSDPQQVCYRSMDNPLSWPEVLVLQYLHGDEAVYNCQYLRTESTSTKQEVARLMSIYGVEPVQTVYPGRQPQLEGVFPGDRPGAAAIPTQDPTPASAALRKAPEKRAAPNRKPEQELEV